MKQDAATHLRRVDALLAQNSWDRTWAQMTHLIERVASERAASIEAPQTAAANRLKRGASAGSFVVAN
jgi:uncharacterized Zn finger protein